jgi:hypothetical protein
LHGVSRARCFRFSAERPAKRERGSGVPSGILVESVISDTFCELSSPSSLLIALFDDFKKTFVIKKL